MERVFVAAREIPVRAEADVVVIGGGAAGVAAAYTAARLGSKTLLVERYGFCGGAAVAGMSGTVCGLYTASSAGRPEQVVFGFAERFVRALADRGGVTEPVRYGKTLVVVHDPLVWREVADALLDAAGVRIFYHTLFVDVLVDDGRIRGVVVEGKEGTFAIRANVVVDASGDGDVAFRAGLPYGQGKDGVVQNPTMIFRMQGVDVQRFRNAFGADTIVPQSVSRLIDELNASGRYRLPRAKVFIFPTPRPGEVLCNATRITGPSGRPLDPTTTEDLTLAEIEGRRQVREYARFFREHIPGFEHAFVNDTGVQVGIRQSRSVWGLYRLTNQDVVGARKFATGIARSPWPIELHSGESPKLIWLEDDYYEIPYECLVPEPLQGLLVAGRCLSAEHEALASARVTAQCFSMGQAAGLAAALSIKRKVPPHALSGEEIRSLLPLEGGVDVKLPSRVGQG